MMMTDLRFTLEDFCGLDHMDYISSSSSGFSIFTFHEENAMSVSNCDELPFERLRASSFDNPFISIPIIVSQRNSLDIPNSQSQSTQPCATSGISELNGLNDITLVNEVSDVNGMTNTSDMFYMDKESDITQSPIAYSSDVVGDCPPMHLSPPAFSSFDVLSKLIEERKQECRRRRQLRMNILRYKRMHGLISFNSSVRYEKRSEFAKSRDRSNGRFVSGPQYSNVTS